MDTIFNTDGCFYRALDDEPVFVLLARDPCFAEAVRWWVTLRQALIGNGQKPLEDHSALAEALDTANAGHIWRQDATDPTSHEGEFRWHFETVPERELVERDKLARMETRLLKDANQFLFYTQQHFDKGTPESIAKGEVNWGHYLDICETMGITPAEKPTVNTNPRHASERLEYDDWVKWQAAAMPLGNDFLLGIHKGRLWFSQRQQVAGAGEQWSELYMLQKSLQYEMIRCAFEDWRAHQHDRADHLKGLLPDYRGLAVKIATGLRQVTRDMLGYASREDIEPMNEDTGFALEAMGQYADRINGYAAELVGETAGFFKGGTIPDGTEAPTILTRERTVGKHPALGAPYGANEVHTAWEEPDSDTIDVTSVPDLPPHRFTMFHKAQGWAYGRGLEINPGHIPAMLDRMDASGWHLQAVFGGTDPQKVGMLFKRTGPGLGWPIAPPRLFDDLQWPEQALLGSFNGYSLWVGKGMPEEDRSRLRRALESACGDRGRGLEP